MVASNAGYANNATLTTAFAAAGACSFPAGSADSAVVMSLASGAYTAQVSSTSSTAAGAVLVEVYSVD